MTTPQPDPLQPSPLPPDPPRPDRRPCHQVGSRASRTPPRFRTAIRPCQGRRPTTRQMLRRTGVSPGPLPVTPSDKMSRPEVLAFDVEPGTDLTGVPAGDQTPGNPGAEHVEEAVREWGESIGLGHPRQPARTRGRLSGADRPRCASRKRATSQCPRPARLIRGCPRAGNRVEPLCPDLRKHEAPETLPPTKPQVRP